MMHMMQTFLNFKYQKTRLTYYVWAGEGTGKMDAASLAMDFANIVNLIGVLLLMRCIIIDRNVLKGYSLSGTFVTFVACVGLEAGFFLLGNFISFAL